MIDNTILASELERLLISVTRLEFSAEQPDRVVESSRKAREALEALFTVL